MISHSHHSYQICLIALFLHGGWSRAFGEPTSSFLHLPHHTSARIGRGARAPTEALSTGAALSPRPTANWSLYWLWGGNSPESLERMLERNGNEDDNRDDRPLRRRRRPGRRAWAKVKTLHKKRRANVVNRKLQKAHERFEKRQYPSVPIAEDDETMDDDDDGNGDDASDEYCFLLPGWYDDSHTLPKHYSTQSVCRDQLPFAHGEIKKMPYVHGGFFGAAPFMLANPHWTSILRTLMPDVFVEISRRASRAPAPRLIHWAENNPVVAAYGTAYELEHSGEMPVLEWDVFLDPTLVRRLKKVLREKDRFLGRQKDAAEISNEAQANEHDANDADGEDGKVMETLSSNNNADTDQKVLSDYDEEIKKWTTLLVEGMLIAHGNARQIITEQAPYFKKLNFSSVKRTRKSVGGGIFARQWLAVYSEAIKLGMGYADDGDGEIDGDGMEGLFEERNDLDSPEIDSYDYRNDAPSMATSEQVEATSLRKASASACPDISIPESISTLPSPISLILDLKSRHISRRVWALVIDYLRDAGAKVEGIASFNVSEMRDITRYCSSPVNEIFFLHSAGDMQRCCHSGQIKRGDRVFFNAGSLFWDFRNADVIKSVLRRGSPKPSFDKKSKEGCRLKPYARIGPCPKDRMPSETDGETFDGILSDSEDSNDGSHFVYEESPDGFSSSTIQQYKEYYDLSIGLYVQECAIDEDTLNLIVKYVNTHSHVFDLGLSWGGFNGLTVKGIQQSRFSINDGLRSQRFVSVPWKKDLYPDRSKRLPKLGFVKKVLFH